MFLKNCLFDETSHHQKSAAFIKELWHPRHWPPRPCAQIRAWQRWMPSFNGIVGPRVFLGVAGGVFVGVAGGVLAKTRRGVREGLLGTSLAGLEGCVTEVCVWKQSSDIMVSCYLIAEAIQKWQPDLVVKHVTFSKAQKGHLNPKKSHLALARPKAQRIWENKSWT